MKKSASEKKVLAAWLTEHTLAPSKWLATSLFIGHPSSVTHAKACCRESEEGKKLLSKLEKGT